MNWDTLKGKWAQLRGEARVKWAKLTDDDFAFVAGERDKLVGKLVERYGLAKERAEAAIDEWVNALDLTPKPRDRRDETDDTATH